MWTDLKMSQNTALQHVRRLAMHRKVTDAGVYAISEYLWDNGIAISGRMIQWLENSPEKHIRLVYKHPKLLKTWYSFYELRMPDSP